jgi:hypothetical protein
MMAWEHSLLGDLDPALIHAAAAGDRRPVDDYRELLGELGRAPRRVDAARLRGAHPGLDLVRLPGSGLAVTTGELNVLPDYLGRPEAIEAAPLRFIGPLIQSVRSWSIAELARPAGRGARPPRPLPRLLPGSMRYPLLGPLAETAEITAVTVLGRRLGFAPTDWYASVLARNAGHFAPFSWYRWHSFHLTARALITRSATARGDEREALRRRARIYAAYADHFLQDSFAAGHLVNKTLVIQWYIEWLAAAGVSYPHRDILDALTVARQPRLHGPGHYDRAAARRRGMTARPGGGVGDGTGDDRAGAVPGPPWDPQDVADAPTLDERIAASGVTGGTDAERRAAYAAYLAMLGSGGGRVPTGDHGAAAGRRDVGRQLGHLRQLPGSRRAGRPAGLPARMAPRRAARPVLRAVRPAVDPRRAGRHVQRVQATGPADSRQPVGLARPPRTVRRARGTARR